MWHTLYVLSSLFCHLDGTPCILCDTPCMCLAACFVAWMESSPLRRDTWTRHMGGELLSLQGRSAMRLMEEHVFGAFVHIQIFAIWRPGVPKKNFLSFWCNVQCYQFTDFSCKSELGPPKCYAPWVTGECELNAWTIVGQETRQDSQTASLWVTALHRHLAIVF